MQHEGVGISAELCDDERNAMCHEAADEMYVAGPAAELPNENRTFFLAGLRERRGELWAAVERVGALARLDLDEFRDEIKSFCFSKAAKCLTACFCAS